MITPVPGGVGPMTIAMLLKNTVRAAQQAPACPDAGSGSRGGNEGPWPGRSWPFVVRPSAARHPAVATPSLFDDVRPAARPESAVAVSTLTQLGEETSKARSARSGCAAR